MVHDAAVDRRRELIVGEDGAPPAGLCVRRECRAPPPVALGHRLVQQPCLIHVEGDVAELVQDQRLRLGNVGEVCLASASRNDTSSAGKDAPALESRQPAGLTHENAAGGSGESAPPSSPKSPGSGVPSPWWRLLSPGSRQSFRSLPLKAHVVEGRHRHEQVPAVAADLVIDVSPLVARVGVGEGVAEPVVRGEAAEEVREPGLGADLPADLGGVVDEDRPAGDASGELEHVTEPLADAFGGLTPEDPGGPHAGAREGDGGVPAPGGHAADPEVRLPEVDLDLAGQPAQGQVTLGVPADALLGYLLARLFT